MLKPAILGGKPDRKNFLVFGKPKITKEEINEVIKTIKSGWLGTGPKTKLFEEKFCRYIGCKHAIALNSCTAGLHLALDVLGIKSGDEVITTPLTFPSTANVIIHHKAKPVFTDVDIKTGNIDPLQIKKHITKRTKAIIPVHLYGNPCSMKEIRQVAKKNNLFVIEDAAHALEAKIYKEKVGNISDFTAFSFYVTKNITTSEGGMLTTNNNKWEEEARIKSLHGISKDAWKRYSASGFIPYETIYPGYKYNMTDIAASLGIHQINKIDKYFAIREKYWRFYEKAFENIKEIILPTGINKGITHARHLFTILLVLEKLKINRNQFIEALKAENIGTGVHFTPIHLHKYYRETYHYKTGDFPNAEYIGNRTISLPFSPYLTKKDLSDVVKAVTKIVDYFRK